MPALPTLILSNTDVIIVIGKMNECPAKTLFSVPGWRSKKPQMKFMKPAEQKWFALEITADAAASEAVEFALNELDALGTEINNLGKSGAVTLTVIGYFNEQFANQIWQKTLLEAVQIYGLSSRRPGKRLKTRKNTSFASSLRWLSEPARTKRRGFACAR